MKLSIGSRFSRINRKNSLSCFNTYLQFSVSFRSSPTLVRPAGGALAKPSLACDPSSLRPHVSGGRPLPLAGRRRQPSHLFPRT